MSIGETISIEEALRRRPNGARTASEDPPTAEPLGQSGLNEAIAKSYQPGDRVYLQGGESAPSGAEVHTGPRGGRFFYWRAGEGHGGWERRRRAARRQARLAQAEEPRVGARVSTSTGPAVVAQMLPSGGAMVETRRGPARIGPEALSDAAKRTQLEEIADSGRMPRSPEDLIEMCRLDKPGVQRLMEALYSTPGNPVTSFSLDESDRRVLFMGKVMDESGQQVGHFARYFYDDGTVYHSLFELKPSFQGGGLAARMNRQAEMAYLAMGFKKVTLNADIDIGKYAWARQGYDFKSPKAMMERKAALVHFLETWGDLSLNVARRKVETLLGDKFHAWDLAALDDGREYDSGRKGSFSLGKAFMLSDWNGSWDAVKIITPGSPGQLVGEAYMNAADVRPRKSQRVAAASIARRSPFILPKEMADLGGDDSAHWDIDERADAAWRLRLGRIRGK